MPDRSKVFNDERQSFFRRLWRSVFPEALTASERRSISRDRPARRVGRVQVVLPLPNGETTTEIVEGDFISITSSDEFVSVRYGVGEGQVAVFHRPISVRRIP
ncbi:hypothetical protein LCGC14_1431100 [marine sediment metagenome]|uniref:Uncharacterized protein n=1 Tax=marine sediment metagenome TaxID=412755 RepID=A0A0F9MQA1_9ZZZZ